MLLKRLLPLRVLSLLASAALLSCQVPPCRGVLIPWQNLSVPACNCSDLRLFFQNQLMLAGTSLFVALCVQGYYFCTRKEIYEQKIKQVEKQTRDLNIDQVIEEESKKKKKRSVEEEDEEKEDQLETKGLDPKQL